MTDSPSPLQPENPRRFQPPSDGELIESLNGRYFLGPLIGKGNFGNVYACRDDWGNDLVAKVLVPCEGKLEDLREDWNHELGNLVTLRHPNITFIYDAFEYRDTFYLVMERCASRLQDLVSLKPFEGEFWVPFVARDVLQAVHFIHLAGYVHKDLHPGNVFISMARDRMIPDIPPVFAFKVGDLGITRLESEIRLFNTLMAQWMVPPEYIDRDQFGAVGKPVDIYHVGLLLLGLLLGEFPGFTREEIVEGVPRQRAESLQSPFAGPISRALRRHVSSRTTSARLFWAELMAAVNVRNGWDGSA